MAQESIEIVRAAIEAWNRADFDAWIGAWDERAEFHPLRAQSDGRAYHGHDGLRPSFRVLYERRKKFSLSRAFFGMELAGLEPATSWVRSRRSPN